MPEALKWASGFGLISEYGLGSRIKGSGFMVQACLWCRVGISEEAQGVGGCWAGG